jgi:hypothetical protein
MKKNIIIIILTLISLASLSYGYMQKLRADEQYAMAIENLNLARDAEFRAEQSQALAEQERIMAEVAMAEAQTALARQLQVEASANK